GAGCCGRLCTSFLDNVKRLTVGVCANCSATAGPASSIGLTVLAGAIALGDFLANLLKTSRIGEILRESLTIGGWVSMWRPLEVFLYDWWPIRNEALLSERLAAMPGRIKYMKTAFPEPL